ncbi:mitochondrial inner membrane protease ATP23 homolog [Penaeus japonicus]|uniref:mitochondrial inner membrane protease ATP23 homolog n=1 Tax=Penaeus japonicus TaxID=27405 RepID=UPI001C711D04|nr:mitochondrial inner membrane protease ATP23 homolog [Penaeus japonicus]
MHQIQRKVLFYATPYPIKVPAYTWDPYTIFANAGGPIVKLMLSALKSSGCEVDLSRHVACEVCDVSVSGGYDPELNQVVVCQNVARSEGMTQGVLTHELIHMFDYCRNKLDFKNVEHLACTEIRAANLSHCSFLSAVGQGDASPFKIAKAHQPDLHPTGQSCLLENLERYSLDQFILTGSLGIATLQKCSILLIN